MEKRFRAFELLLFLICLSLLFLQAEGHIVTLESGTGETYRGKLIEAEDNMNCQLASVTVTARDGKSSQVEHVYIRGSNIK